VKRRRDTNVDCDFRLVGYDPSWEPGCFDG
jgi:hypothetical protein